MIEALKNIGFVVTERLERKELSSDLQNRYSELPADYQEFLQRFQTITNESDNVWFNSIEDFNGESDSGFRWNEFELMGLEALADDKDSCDMIRLFWDSHIPILMSVKDGYQYLCIDFLLLIQYIFVLICHFFVYNNKKSRRSCSRWLIRSKLS